MTGRSKSLGGHADVTQLRSMLGKSSQLEPAMKRALRKNLRAAAMPTADEMRSTVRQAPTRPGVQHQPHPVPLRETIAAGITVSILAGNRAGIVIRASGKGLPASSLVTAWDNPKGWRHPAFTPDTWVQQYGRPYFRSVAKRHQEQSTRAAVRALNEATAVLKGH